jgi:hypothetical protein
LRPGFRLPELGSFVVFEVVFSRFPPSGRRVGGSGRSPSSTRPIRPLSRQTGTSVRADAWSSPASPDGRIAKEPDHLIWVRSRGGVGGFQESGGNRRAFSGQAVGSIGPDAFVSTVPPDEAGFRAVVLTDLGKVARKGGASGKTIGKPGSFSTADDLAGAARSETPRASPSSSDRCAVRLPPPGGQIVRLLEVARTRTSSSKWRPMQEGEGALVVVPAWLSTEGHEGRRGLDRGRSWTARAGRRRPRPGRCGLTCRGWRSRPTGDQDSCSTFENSRRLACSSKTGGGASSIVLR